MLLLLFVFSSRSAFVVLSLNLFSLSLPLSLSLSLLSSPLLFHQLDHANVGPPGLAVDGHGGHALDPVLDRVGDVGDNLRKWGREFVEKREG